MAGSIGRKHVDLTRDAAYALGSDDSERQRLRRQSEELSTHSAALLDLAGIELNWNVIDLGCGPCGVVDLLSERVGPHGHVTGLDVNPANILLARDFVSERRLENVELIEGDARHTGLPADSFDLVHARTLLVNLPEPQEVVAEMVRLVKAGGVVALMEPDTSMTVCYPALPQWERMNDVFFQSYRKDGADPLIGRRLSELLRNAGLIDIQVEARADVFPAGYSRRTVRPDLVRSMRSKIIARGIAGEDELVELDRAVRAHLDDPRTLVMHLMFMAWGSKPTA